MKTSKFFHAIVVLGMSVAAETACTSEEDPAPTTKSDAGSTDTPDNTDETDKPNPGETVSDAGSTDKGDAFAGWSLCG